jgi:hypothetical protein
MNYQILLYECKIWTLNISEIHRLAVFENEVLTRIYGPKRQEVTE